MEKVLLVFPFVEKQRGISPINKEKYRQGHDDKVHSDLRRVKQPLIFSPLALIHAQF